MNKFFDDSDQLKWDRISNLYGVPQDFNVKEAADTKFISISDFAYPEKELYPINTPKNTIVSYCYANEDTNIPADTKQRVLASIKNAADFWGVKLPNRIAEKPVVTKKHVIKVATEKGTQQYTVNNDTELKGIVDYLEKNASDFSYASRRQIAMGVLNAPKEFQKQLTRNDLVNLQKTAGDMFVAPSDIKVACEIRAQYADAMGKQEFGKILRDFGKMQPAKITKEMVIKTASMLDYVDRVTGMNEMYRDGKLAVPEYSIHGAAKADVELFIDKTIGMKNGSAFVKNDIITNKDKVLSFFKDFTGEDLSKESDANIFTKIASLDEVGANAFQEITGLCMHN